MANNSTLVSVQDFYIDANSPRIKMQVYSLGSSYSHKLLVKNGSTTLLTITIGSISPMGGNSNTPTSVGWGLNSTQVATLGAAFPNVASFNATFVLQTYNNNTQVGSDSTATANIMVSAANSSPTMGTWSYADVSTEGYAISGNTSKIVNSVSTIRFSNFTATAKNGATIVRYEITAMTGESTSASSAPYDWAWSTDYNFGNYTTETAFPFTITAYDSRGFRVSVSNQVSVIPYEPVSVMGMTIRRHSTTPTHPTFVGSGFMQRAGSNNITVSFRYREAGVSSWTSGGTLPFDWQSGGVVTNRRHFTVNTTAQTVTLAEDKVYVIELTIADNAGSSRAYTQIAYLTPSHMHLSFRENSLGIGGVPSTSNAVEIDSAWKLITKGKMDTGSAKYYRSGDYSINMRDSDIIGANGIYFYDLADARDEGLVFPRTTANKWDTFYVADGDAYIRRNHDIDAFVSGVRLLTADDLYYKNGDTFTVSNGTFLGHITSAYKAIRLSVTVPKMLDSITSVTVTTLTGQMRGAKGYLDSDSTDRNWKNLGTVTANIASPNMVRINIDTTNAISNVDLNTPIEFYSASNGLVLTFNTT